MGVPVARRMWSLFEPIHAVTYFAQESRAAADAIIQSGLIPAINPIGLPLQRISEST